jgi:hypothetical protein
MNESLAGPVFFANGSNRESAAAGVREVDGADKRDRYQHYDGGKKSIDDHQSLPKTC